MADEPELTWETEKYDPIKPGETALAQVVFDTGLLYMVNAAVLHPHGLALGVSTSEDDPNHVIGLNLHRTSDPQGVWYDEDLTVRAREKLQAAGLLLGGQRG